MTIVRVQGSRVAAVVATEQVVIRNCADLETTYEPSEYCSTVDISLAQTG